MLFWVIAAILTLGASLAVLLPLAGGGKGASTSSDHDLEVYRDQLAELERDVFHQCAPTWRPPPFFGFTTAFARGAVFFAGVAPKSK